jgi:hypothetical protein
MIFICVLSLTRASRTELLCEYPQEGYNICYMHVYTYKQSISNEGGIEAIVHAMFMHVSNADVQEQACRALGKLAANPENKEALAKAGGVEAIVQAMHEHVSNADVQEQACSALRDLATRAENKQVIRDAGGVQAIEEAMEQHVSNAGIQEQENAALRNIRE